jgi:hypothetical protein
MHDVMSRAIANEREHFMGGALLQAAVLSGAVKVPQAA